MSILLHMPADAAADAVAAALAGICGGEDDGDMDRLVSIQLNVSTHPQPYWFHVIGK